MQLWCLHLVIPKHCLRNLKSSLKNQIDQQEHRKQSEWQHDDGLKKTKMISLGCHCSSLRAKDPSLSLSQYVVYFCLENVLLYWSMDQYNNVWKGVVEKGVARKGLKLRQHVWRWVGAIIHATNRGSLGQTDVAIVGCFCSTKTAKIHSAKELGNTDMSLRQERGVWDWDWEIVSMCQKIWVTSFVLGHAFTPLFRILPLSVLSCVWNIFSIHLGALAETMLMQILAINTFWKKIHELHSNLNMRSE